MSVEEYFRRPLAGRLADLVVGYAKVARNDESDRQSENVARILSALHWALTHDDVKQISKWEEAASSYLKRVDPDGAERLGVLRPRQHRGRKEALSVLFGRAKVLAENCRSNERVNGYDADERIARMMCLVARNTLITVSPDETKLTKQIARARMNHDGKRTWPRKIVSLTLSECGWSSAMIATGLKSIGE